MRAKGVDPTPLRCLPRGLDLVIRRVRHQHWEILLSGPTRATLSLFGLFGVWQRHSVDLLKPNDVARQLAVSRAWVYEAARTGRIPSVRIGGEDGPLRFIPEDIDRWLADARAGWSPGRGTSAAEYEPATRSSRARPHRARRSAATSEEQQSLL
jgi:excisionase family DNA binding protein